MTSSSRKNVLFFVILLKGLLCFSPNQSFATPHKRSQETNDGQGAKKLKSGGSCNIIELVENQFQDFWKANNFRESKKWSEKYQTIKKASIKDIIDVPELEMIVDDGGLNSLLNYCAKNPKSEYCWIEVDNKPTNHDLATPLLSALILEYGVKTLNQAAEFFANIPDYYSSDDRWAYIETTVANIAYGASLHFIKTGQSSVIEISLGYLTAKVKSLGLNEKAVANYFAKASHKTICGLHDEAQIDLLLQQILSSRDSYIQCFQEEESENYSDKVDAIHNQLRGIIQNTLSKANIDTDKLNRKLYDSEDFWKELKANAEKYASHSEAKHSKRPSIVGSNIGVRRLSIASRIEADTSESQDESSLGEQSTNQHSSRCNFLSDPIEIQAELKNGVETKIASLKKTSSIRISDYCSMTPTKVKRLCLSNVPKAETYVARGHQKFLSALAKPETAAQQTCVLYDCCKTNLENSKRIWSKLSPEHKNNIFSALQSDNGLFADDRHLLGSLCERNLDLNADLLETPSSLFSCALSMMQESDLIKRVDDQWIIIKMFEDFYERSNGSSDVDQHVAQNISLLKKFHSALLTVEIEDCDGIKTSYKELLEEELQESNLSENPEFIAWILE